MSNYLKKAPKNLIIRCANSKQQPPKKLLFGELILQWCEKKEANHKGSTADKYKYIISTHILPELGEIPVDNLKSSVIAEFTERKLSTGRLDSKGGLSASYVRLMCVMIQAAIDYGVEHNICRPPAVKIRKPRSDKKEPEILSLSQQKQLESKLFSDINETKLGILISLYMGLRIGEVCALKWENVNLIDNELLVCSTVVRLNDKSTSGKATKMVIDTPKTKTSVRKIPIPPLLISVMHSVKASSASPYVVSKDETFINPRTLEYRYKKLLESVGIPRLNYHALRHTFATRCIEVGMDMKTLSELLGHASVSTTMDIYVHSTMEQKRRQMEKLSNFFVSQNK